MKKLGYLMLAMPFIGFFTFVVNQAGILPALGVFGAAFGVVAWIGIGVFLSVD